MLIQEPIQASIWHFLNNYSYTNATFIAERLQAEVDSEETLHILATTHYRFGKAGRAYTIIKDRGFSSPQLKYLMAKCCFDLGKLDEAETTLTGGSVLKPKSIEDLVTEFGTMACFALQLLGLICYKTERASKAIEALKRSLKLNPLMWDAFVLLCDMGDEPDPSKTFKLDSIDTFLNMHGNTISSLMNQCENTNINSSSTTNLNTSPVDTFFVSSHNTLSNVSTNTIEANNQTNQQLHHTQQIMNIHSQQHINPPINTTIPLITTTPTPMQINSSSVSTPILQNLAGLNTPLNMPPPSSVPQLSDTIDSFDSSITKTKKFVRFQKFFGTPSCLSPISPSFGILPLDLSNLNTDSDVSLLNSSVAYITPSPLSQLDSQTNNKIQNINKRILGRNLGKDPPPLVMNKPAVFAPAGNNSNYQSPPTGQSHVRRSQRLFGNSSVKENNKNQNRFVTPKSPARKSKTRSSKNQNSLSELNEKNKNENLDLITSTEKTLADKPCTINISQQVVTIQKHSAEGLMTLLKDIGSAYLQLSQFNCRKAIELFSALPSQHYHTGWVLANMAKAYFEMDDHNEACRFFNEVREKEPYSLHLMEYYSTALWHLQKEVQLSSLAQDVVEVDRDSPQAWCVTGNCFSSQKEHEAAIKFFSRAIQVDPNFAYAYTLLGHEHLATEELDRALSCYRSAVRIDPRHYNAWYGIGLVYLKQERFEQAEWYFKKAVGIHPQSAVLLCHVAVVEQHMQKSQPALQTLKKALAIDSKNPLCKYHRASILHSIDNHKDALQELLQLKEIVPKESNVYFLLGKVYKHLGETHLALMNFSWAMDLDPKGSKFKEAIDPAINCFPPEEEDTTNNNPQENVTSEASSSLMAAESSQESLILEPSSDNPQISGIEEHPISTSLSASILGPSSGLSLASSSANNEIVTPSSSTSALPYGLMTAPSSSTVAMPSTSSSASTRISTSSSFDSSSSTADLISWISGGGRNISRSRRIPGGQSTPSSGSSSSSTSGIQISSSPSTGGPTSNSNSTSSGISNSASTRFVQNLASRTPSSNLDNSMNIDDSFSFMGDSPSASQQGPRSDTPTAEISSDEIL